MEHVIPQNQWVRNPNVTLMLALGVLGGTVIILSQMFFLRGKYLLLAYAGVVIATGIILKTTKVTRYGQRFGIGLGAFMLASLSHYVFLQVAERTSLTPLTFLGHTWRIGFMLVIGAAINLALARVTE